MKALILFVAWCILFVLCWPVALLALGLLPLIWLISLPLRLVGITLEAVFAFFRALLSLPVRLLDYRKNKTA